MPTITPMSWISWLLFSKAQVQWRKTRRNRRFRTLQRRAPRAALKVAGRCLGRGVLARTKGSAAEQRGRARKTSGDSAAAADDDDDDDDEDDADHFSYPCYC